MWILLRIGFALFVTLARLFWPRTLGGSTRHGSGRLAYSVRRTRNKHRITGTYYGLPCANPMFLRLTPERSWDRLFKTLGFSRELQTGDDAFDRSVYVACDDPALAPVLQADASIRDAVRAAFATGVTKIFTDGENLWAYRPGEHLPSEYELGNLDTLRIALEVVPVLRWSGLRDPFVRRVLVVESLAWGVAAYGAPSLVQLVFREAPIYLDWTPLLWTGLALAAVLFAGLLLLIRSMLGGSARGHRIVVESTLLLALGLPLTGIELTSDANQYFDTAAPETLRPIVSRKFETTRRGKKGRTTTYYHLQLDPGADPKARALLPATIKTDLVAYQFIQTGSRITLKVRPGALGFPWVESMRAR